MSTKIVMKIAYFRLNFFTHGIFTPKAKNAAGEIVKGNKIGDENAAGKKIAVKYPMAKKLG